MISGVKMYPNQKMKYVAGGHLTNTPSSMIHKSIVSIDIARINCFVASLKNLGILAGDIHNEYLNVETKEKSLFYVKVE